MPPRSGFDLFKHRGAPVGSPVRDHHPRPFAGEQHRAGPPDARRGPGDDRRFALQYHSVPPGVAPKVGLLARPKLSEWGRPLTPNPSPQWGEGSKK